MLKFKRKNLSLYKIRKKRKFPPRSKNFLGFFENATQQRGILRRGGLPPSRLPARSALLLRRGVHRTPAPPEEEGNSLSLAHRARQFPQRRSRRGIFAVFGRTEEEATGVRLREGCGGIKNRPGVRAAVWIVLSADAAEEVDYCFAEDFFDEVGEEGYQSVEEAVLNLNLLNSAFLNNIAVLVKNFRLHGVIVRWVFHCVALAGADIFTVNIPVNFGAFGHIFGRGSENHIFFVADFRLLLVIVDCYGCDVFINGFYGYAAYGKGVILSLALVALLCGIKAVFNHKYSLVFAF